MSKPPRPSTALGGGGGPSSSSSSSHHQHNHNRAGAMTPDLISTQDGYAQLAADGEIHVGRACGSVVYRRRKASAAPLGRSTPLVPDGRYTSLPKDFVYGVANKKDPEDTDKILHSWKQHSPPQTKLQYDFGRDFMSLNRHCLNQRCTTPSSVRWFRTQHDARLKPKKHVNEGSLHRSRSHNRDQAVHVPSSDVSAMRAAGVASDVASIPELRFAQPVGSASNSATSTSRSERNNNMSSLVAHEYRYAWVAQKIAEHEDKRRKAARAASATPSSISRRNEEMMTMMMMQQEQEAAAAAAERHRNHQNQRPGSANSQQQQNQQQQKRRTTNVPSPASLPSADEMEEQHSSQQQQQTQQPQQQNQQNHYSSQRSHSQQPHHHNTPLPSMSELGVVQGPSGRLVSHYPKIVSQRLREARAKDGSLNHVHPKEYYNMKQFKNVHSRVFVPQAQQVGFNQQQHY